MEIWDLYTADRVKTDRTMVRGEKPPKGYWHIVVHVCIFNAKGELLIQQRQPFKEGWPNMWDVTVGGSAISGDSSQQAAERETMEEIGYRLCLDGETPALTVNVNRVFDDYYIVEREVDLSALTLQPDEVQAVEWATLPEVLARIAEGTFIPYHRSFIELLFFMRTRRSVRTRREGEA